MDGPSIAPRRRQRLDPITDADDVDEATNLLTSSSSSSSSREGRAAPLSSDADGYLVPELTPSRDHDDEQSVTSPLVASRDETR